MDGKKLKDIAAAVGGQLEGDGELVVNRIKDLSEAGVGDLAFILHPRFAGLMETTEASCVVVPMNVPRGKSPVIKVKNPQVAFKLIADFFGASKIPHPKGVHKTAVIGNNVKLGKDVGIGPYAVIADDAVLGDRSVVYPFSYIGNETVLGEDCIIYSNVTIREKIKIGSRVIIHPGSVIGGDGFGYDSSMGLHMKIPQIGDVIIEDDVEIGACVTVDRAKLAHTIIGRNTKIDNLVQIAHNVKIGSNCIIVAQCGISGSCTLGKNVIMGGQVGVADHINIGDNVMAAARTGIMKSIPSNMIVWGLPARNMRRQKILYAVFDKLPEIYERLKKVEKALEQNNK